MEDMEAKSKAEIEEKVSPNHSSIKDEQNSEQILFQQILGRLNQSPGNPSTRRLPKDFRATKCYKPDFVSIGPFHWARYANYCEDDKWRYMVSFLQRTSSKLEECLERCSAAILELDSVVSQSYSYVRSERMLVDGCFILEIFLRYKSRDFFGYTNDPILDDAMRISELRHDLALLENQIPFIVLEKLTDIIRAYIPDLDFEGQPSISIITNLALFFFHSDEDPFGGRFVNFGRFVNSRIEMSCSESYKHLLHLLHDFQVQSLNASLTKERNQNCCLLRLERELLPVCYKNNKQKAEDRMDEPNICATRLLEDGIDFERGTEAYLGGLLGITFSKGVMKIPPLYIKKKTESLLRNLIAFEFEQCSDDSTHHITSYVILLSSLIHSSRDIELLQQKKIIIIDWGTAEDVLKLFNRFSMEVATKDNCFVNLIGEVHEYRKSYWYRHKRIWKLQCQKYLKILHKDYFSSPWSILSFIAACVLLVLTGLQTYYTIYSKNGS